MPSNRDRVPAPLRKILDWDQVVTNKVCEAAYNAVPNLATTYQTYLKALEISCHGVPWFIFTLISIYLFRSIGAREVQINLLFGLVYDVMLVAFLKAITRRARPPGNRTEEMFLATGADKFSFPSGHATRAVFVAFFFTKSAFPDTSILFTIPLFIWAIAVCISRILLRRHYVVDVSSGAVIGYLEFLLSAILWVGPEAAKYLGDWIATSEDEYNG